MPFMDVTKRTEKSPGSVAPLAEAWSHTPKGCGFNFQSGHLPGLRVPSSVGALMRGNESMFLFHICVFFSLSPIFSLKSMSISPDNHQAVDSVHDFFFGGGVLLFCSITHPNPGPQCPIPDSCLLLSTSLSDLLKLPLLMAMRRSLSYSHSEYGSKRLFFLPWQFISIKLNTSFIIVT